MWSVSRRLWILPDCPPDLVNNAPEGYGAGCCALAYGGTDSGAPPTEWLDNLPAILGLTPEAAATVHMRPAGGFLWTAYWDPTGQTAPAQPKLLLEPPEIVS